MVLRPSWTQYSLGQNAGDEFCVRCVMGHALRTSKCTFERDRASSTPSDSEKHPNFTKSAFVTQQEQEAGSPQLSVLGVGNRPQSTNMSSTYESLLVDEVGALRAIFGDEQISFRRRQSDVVPASITISLETLLADKPHAAGSHITLSALLPDGYPREERPKNPVLRADGLSKARAEKIVQQMLENDTSAEGEVCLFQYCSEMIAILNDYSVEEKASNNGKAGPSNAAEGESTAPAAGQLEIFHGEPLTDRKSVFQAHIALVKSIDDVDSVLLQLKQNNRKISTATHNTLAYRIIKGNILLQDVDDDGEKGAGKCVLYVLQQMSVANVVCIVSRWFGGTKLGPVRFKHISKVTRDLIEKHASEFPTANNREV